MLADHMDRDRNSFSLLRLVAAACVVLSHSFLIVSGTTTSEPLAQTMAYNLSQQAVHVFFVVSGLTLAQSWVRDPNVGRFAWSRILRIFPGLFAVGVLFAFVLGPIVTRQPPSDYWFDAHTWLYPFAVLVFFNEATPPHLIFDTVPLVNDANAPIWTIKYELIAYVVFAFCCLLGWMTSARHALAWLAFAVVCVFAMEHVELPPLIVPPLESMLRFGICFLGGVLLFYCRERVPTSPWLLAVTVPAALLFDSGIAGQLACFALAGSIVVVFGSRRYGVASSWTTRTDVSYGLYLYAWPIQQSLLTAFPDLSVTWLTAVSLGLATLLGLLSWHWIEKPALQWRPRPEQFTPVPSALP